MFRLPRRILVVHRQPFRTATLVAHYLRNAWHRPLLPSNFNYQQWQFSKPSPTQSNFFSRSVRSFLAEWLTLLRGWHPLVLGPPGTIAVWKMT